MNTYGDEETEFAKKEVRELVKEKVIEWGKFAGIFLVGFILITVSLPFASILLINPRPFTLLFSLGSFIILVAILTVINLSQLATKCGTFFGLVLYASTLGLGIYSGLFHLGYLKTLLVMGVQMTSLLYIMVSQFPGGKEGVSSCLNSIRTQILRIIWVKN